MGQIVRFCRKELGQKRKTFNSFFFQSQGRAEIMTVLSKMISGLGNAASSIFKDLYKIIKAHMTDRVMSVRVATVNVSENNYLFAPHLGMRLHVFMLYFVVKVSPLSMSNLSFFNV